MMHSLTLLFHCNGYCFLGLQEQKHEDNNKIATLQQEENHSMKTGMYKPWH